MDMNRRVLRMLQAVAEGRAEMTCSCEPDLYVDGMCVCDQFTAHNLAGAGLIRPMTEAPLGQRVRATLSDTGRSALGAGSAAA